MSFEINSIQSAQGAGAEVARSKGGADAVHVTAQEAVQVDTFPAAPPPELYDAFAVASQVYDRMAAGGKHLHFTAGADGGLKVELQDGRGNTISTVAPSAVLALAGGEKLAAAR